jgi:DNA-binding transcriptional LysR family regulator
MDIDLARTFLEVVAAGNFVGAAERLHVTQSTVSMRIRSLEQQLGRTLFERSKAGASLTAAGNQFHRHALALVRVWEQARHEVALPSGYQAALTVAGSFSLWDGLLLRWIARMRRTAPDVALRSELGFSGDIMRGLVDGLYDIGVMYTPESRPGLVVERLIEDELVFVSTNGSQNPRPLKKQIPGADYIYVDWGPEFQRDHALNFPDLSTPGLFLRLGSLALKLLLAGGGSGYCPLRIVRPHLDAGTMRLLPGAPVFSYPAYVVYPADSASDALGQALTELRRVAGEEAQH